jgi:LVIVD repeat
MRRLVRFVVPSVLVLGLVTWALPAGAGHVPDQSKRMFEEFTSPNQATNSDLAFWGDYAFVGYYTGGAGFPPGTGPRGGVRIFDISDPASPSLVRDFACDGAQNDPILWDRNGNGVPDLLLLAVDTTMASPECGAARVPGGTPTGWEGVRVFTMSDDPANPFTSIQQVKSVYTDCGAHTITLWPEEPGRLVVYVSSYPLGAGPTCGDTEYLNTANPYDEDPGSPANPLHGVIQIVEVPLANPAAAQELDVQPQISYPGDPDGKQEWGEKGLPSPPFEPAAVACHDIVVHIEHRLAGAACAEQGQVWEIGANGIPDTQNPISIGDDEVSSGGTGQFPGAVDFFHSVMFDNEGEVVNWVDESFGSGCPPMTTYQPRPWNPTGGTHKTGRMFFSDLEGNFLSEFHVGDLRPDPSAGEYCSAHMGMAIPGINDDLLVNAWYTGGVNVIDFSDASKPREVAFYDPQRNSGTWSAYPYTGPLYQSGPGIPVYASDGVTNNGQAQGMVVYRTIVQKPGIPNVMDHMNPQTMD